MNSFQIERIKEIVAGYPQIKLVYFFGSQAKKEADLLSDYDFAIYLNESDNLKMRDIQFELAAKIAKVLQTDKLDIIVMNLVNNPVLKYNIIKDGRIIFEKSPYRVLAEPKILNEYFDFQTELVKNNLTRAVR